MPENGMTENILSKLNYPEFWEKPSSEWRDVENWDTFFIEENPTTPQLSHNSLGLELDIIIKYVDRRTRASKKAIKMRDELKKKNNKKRTNHEVQNEECDVLFDEMNETALVETIDENKLKGETKLPAIKPEYKLSSGGNLFNLFKKYQTNIPKCRRVTTPAYWGILDLTQESLYGCKEFSDADIQELSQDFANNIAWNPKPAPAYLQDYFNSNCENTQGDKNMKKLHSNIQYIKGNMYSFHDSMTEEELKMISTFPLFRSIFQPNLIKDAWGEIQALGTKNARDENSDPFKRARLGRKVDMKATLVRTPNKFEVLFGEVSGGLAPLGISSSSRKKRYFDKTKLTVIMRDSLNSILKECRHVADDQRKTIVVYGWLQAGLNLKFYAMDWFGGLYRFGLIDQCILPSEEDNCEYFEDVFCVLKELEEKLLQTEKSVKELLLENIHGKRRRISTENSPILNTNRTPPSKLKGKWNK